MNYNFNAAFISIQLTFYIFYIRKINNCLIKTYFLDHTKITFIAHKDNYSISVQYEFV